MSDIVISVRHVRKTYRRYKSNFQKIQHMLFLSSAGEKVRVLRDVSFEICRGERVAILAAPSSGKTTIMNILASIISPENGEVVVNGDVTTLFNHKLGFENALTGRDNYEILASLLGWSKEEMKEREAAVFGFAGIDEEIEVPIREYKKGQAAMLGFATSTIDKPDIFLMDEKFAFGGKKNSNRAVKRLKKLLSDPDATLVMSADETLLPYAEQLCSRGIVISKGKVIFDGSYEEAVESYNENCSIKQKKGKKKEVLQDSPHETDHEADNEDNRNDADNGEDIS